MGKKKAIWQEQYRESDRDAGFDITDDFEPFTQRNDMFTRAFWDETIRSKDTEAFFSSYRVEAAGRGGKGFQQKDMALRQASWAISDFISERSTHEGRREGFQSAIELDAPVASTKVPFETPDEAASEIKEIAKLFGADLVGITDFDPRWIYTSRVDCRDFSETPNPLPDNMTSVIVMGHAMDFDLVKTYPSALAGAATGLEYSHEAAIVMQLATYIRGMGYEAIASMNDTGLVIPYAIKAGLGEYARNQMVITPEFGPRVRFSKIFTNLPLDHDKPKQFGVRAFCDICTKCADACPPKALPYGPPDDATINQSSIKGVRKWTADCEKCFGFWAKLKSDCAICMRVCPFNRKGDGFLDWLFFKLAAGPFRRIALWLDDLSTRANRMRPDVWWSR